MRRFVLGWKKLGHEKRLKAYILNYADDLVICCRDKATEALVCARDLEGVVAKWKRGRYMEGERTSWIKIKNREYSQSIGREKLWS
ncbi:MAG TPA: hypothetical protein VEI01_20405 [Terriglobales bacterium]|nr:hypothetical protein [Terriglobales bacterium]